MLTELRKIIGPALGTYKFYLLALVINSIVIDILFVPMQYDFVFLIITFFWGVTVASFKWKGYVSGGVGIGLLFFVGLALLTGRRGFTERIAGWAYIFFAVCFFQQLFEWVKEGLDRQR